MEENNKKIFHCEKCNYSTSDASNYKKHLVSKKHLGIEKEKVVKEEKEYHCKLCDYTTKDYSNFSKHNKSKSHLSKESGIEIKPIIHSYQCCWCDFEHKNSQSYIKHMMCECPNKPQKPMVIMAGIKGIKLQLSKLKDKDRPRYVSDGITFDAETIKEKTAIYEKRLEEETKKYNDALKNPPNFDIEEIINTELKRNKCYKENRDKEFMEKVKRVLNGEDSESDSDSDSD